MPEDSPSIYTIMAERVANAVLGKINALIGSHNTNEQAHQDIRGDIPSYTSELNNDSGFITISSVPSASSTTPSADTATGGVGAGITWARSDHTHPKSSLYAESTHTHSDANITTLGFYGNLPQANYENPSQQQVNSAINSAMGGKEDNANKVTSLSGSSTDTQYPSAKAVYDATFNLDILDCINENFTILSLPQIVLTYNEDSFDGSGISILNTYTEGAYVGWGDETPVETYESTDTLEHSYSDNVQEHTITIYGNIPNLYKNSFRSLTGITSINIPSSVTSLGQSCFNGCTGLTNITIPSSITSLGNSCFNSCHSLTNVTIPSSVTSLGNSCFNSCYSLTNVTIPSSVTSLGDSCFNGCTGLTSVDIPSGITSLRMYCFHSCYSLTNVTIPSSVTTLGIQCFYRCSGLTSVNIPSSVTSIGGGCFAGCTNLVDYQLYWETPPVNWDSNLMPNNTDTYFTIPNGTTANYTAKGFPSDKLVERSE